MTAEQKEMVSRIKLIIIKAIVETPDEHILELIQKAQGDEKEDETACK